MQQTTSSTRAHPASLAAERFERAATLQDFMENATENRELWRAVAGRAVVPAELALRAADAVERSGVGRLLVLVEDWCGDAVNTVPVIDALAAAVPGLALRVIGRDANPDLMDAHLTNGSRSIPLVIALRDDGAEAGVWGPRPAALQRWVLDQGRALEKEERYREVRRWYARDRGLTTLEEIVAMLESAPQRPTDYR